MDKFNEVEITEEILNELNESKDDKANEMNDKSYYQKQSGTTDFAKDYVRRDRTRNIENNNEM